MTGQVLYDRGYRSYLGDRTGTLGAVRAVYKDGVRRVLGLGRKARRKILPWSLITIALIGAAVFIGLHFLAGSLPAPVAQGLPRYGELFDFYSAISLLFIALAGPELLAPDRAQGVINVYFSRPLTVGGYLGAKLSAFLTVAGAIYVVPQVALHLGLAFVSRDGFLTYLGQNIDVLWKVPITTLGYLALHGAVVFALASVIDRTGISAVTFLAILTAGGAIAGRVSQVPVSGARYLALAALDHHPRIIRDHLFAIETVEYPAEAAGFEVWVSVVVVLTAVALSALLVYRRYRRLA